MAKAYSYLRFSTPEQIKGDSYRRQTQLAQQYAERHGLELDTQLTLNDLGVSAFRGRNARSGALGAFLQAIDADMVAEGSLLLVESLDRVTRQDPWDALPLFQQIINAGVTIVTLQDGKTYSKEEMRANPIRILESLFVMIRANEESATKSRRLKAAWSGKRQRAKERLLTSRAPYWLQLSRDTRTFEVIEDRAAVVRRVFEMTLRGIGQHKIAETFNKEGVPVFGKGAHWHRSYVNKLLNNPATVGTLVPHTLEYDEGKKQRKAGTPVEGYYPAVVEREVFEDVQALLHGGRSPLRGRHALNGTVSNIFGGLARCPLCGGSMTRVNKGAGNGAARLVCTKARTGAGCKYRAVNYDRVEEAFFRDGQFQAATAPAGDDTVDREITGLEDSIEATQDEIERLLKEFGRGRSPTAAQVVRDLEASVDEQQKRLDELYERRAATSGPLVQQRLTALTDALGAAAPDKRAVNLLLRQLLFSATIDYPRGCIVLAWKHGGESEVVYSMPEEEVEATGAEAV